MPATVAQKNKAMRREAVLEVLRNKGLVQKVLETVDKLEELDPAIDSLAVQKLQIGINTRLSLIRKFLPDLKATELTGAEGAPLFEKIVRELIERPKD